MVSGFTIDIVYKRTIHLVILILLPFLTFSQSMSVSELMRQTETNLQWDPYNEIGILKKENQTLTFSLDNSWMVGNYKERINSGAVLKEKGVLIFSNEAVNAVKEFFGVSEGILRDFNIHTIIIDPGHGGRDPGTINTVTVNGIPVLVEEKNIVLDVSLRLADLLNEKYPDKNIVLTRSDDSYPTLEERVVLANAVELGPKEGILFVAVHVNAALNRLAEGYEVWHLPEEYRRDVIGDEDSEIDGSLTPVINTILEEQYSMDSVRLAQYIIDGFGDELPRVPSRGLREESWYVVRNAKMAAVLVELGYITNKEEAQRMMQTSYLKKLTNGLYNGINRFVDYFEEKGFGR